MNTEKAIDLLDNLVLMMLEDDYESDYDIDGHSFLYLLNVAVILLGIVYDHEIYGLRYNYGKPEHYN